MQGAMFEYVQFRPFTLSISLGLVLTEVLGGAAGSIEEQRRVRIGWATGTLAGAVVADITLLLRIWRAYSVIPDPSAALFAGVIICGLYYSQWC
jgi:hypothetical protein